ncbi:hypothetical protein ACQ3G6_16210 [Allorhizobium undicola]|uniref:hypothetical protein n=1 Tax=Allorhizobium undicola TaxID=78527 RepID=UPI00146FB9CB|nr:hypothetical protein [Allorhizobium undicola]
MLEDILTGNSYRKTRRCRFPSGQFFCGFDEIFHASAGQASQGGPDLSMPRADAEYRFAQDCVGDRYPEEAFVDLATLSPPIKACRDLSDSLLTLRALFDLIASNRRSKILFWKQNLVDPRFTPVGLCSKSLFCRMSLSQNRCTLLRDIL